jgi:membrane protein implicated in regulation of membrane protease activity
MSEAIKETKIHETMVASVIISVCFIVAIFVSLGLGFNAVAVGLLVFAFINLLRVLYLETKTHRQLKTKIQKQDKT